MKTLKTSILCLLAWCLATMSAFAGPKTDYMHRKHHVYYKHHWTNASTAWLRAHRGWNWKRPKTDYMHKKHHVWMKDHWTNADTAWLRSHKGWSWSRKKA